MSDNFKYSKSNIVSDNCLFMAELHKLEIKR